MKNLTIRELTTTAELEEVFELEAFIWNRDDAVPPNQTITSVKNGGFVLGMFAEHRLIGFQYSFPGFNGTDVYLCSHTLVVHPDYQKQGLGEQLKQAQRKLAEAKGYETIQWTYDPLESVNAKLNLHKLDATSNVYIENAYGELHDDINAGMPTDRLVVSWSSRPVPRQQVSVEGAEAVYPVEERNSIPVPGTIRHAEAAVLLVPVPASIQQIKHVSQEAALTWRLVQRSVLPPLFAKGYSIVDYLPYGSHYAYVLTKERPDAD
ncbi:GNAT family N-acetyltransferase [Alkalicoccus luteus]|uniref:GNAT family N-acetyltransferase n=1 Tax=Alkalicoccus luteus TaxID=1237094 RepID=UPI001FE5A354|nr:GNAT family N-acetyltransferase [Alkalicoccus luteus]